MATGFRDRAFNAVLWSFTAQVGQFGIQALVSIVLVRLLSPPEIGLISMLWIFIAVAQKVIDGGFGQALLQRRDATRADESSVFYFNAVIACVAAAVVWAAAPWIGQFYDIPALVSLARATSLSLPIAALALVHVTSLSRRLDMRTQAKAGCFAAMLAGTVGICMAYAGFGAWSLVGQLLSLHCARTAALWYLSPWRPGLVFRLDSLRAMFPVGSRLLASSVLNAVFGNLYPVVIGRVFSSRELGYYVVAGRIPALFSESLAAIVSRVTVPVYPGLRDDPARFRETLRKALTMMAAVNTPLMVGIAVLAEPIVRILMTEKWLPAVPYLRLFCLVLAISPIQQGNLDALLCLGKSGVWLRLHLTKKALSLANILVSYRWGIQALLLGEFGASLVVVCLGALGVSRSIGYTPWQQLRDLLPYWLASLVMGGTVFLVGHVDLHQPAVELTLGVLVGIASYLVMGLVLRLRALRELGELSLHSWINRSVSTDTPDHGRSARGASDLWDL